LGWFRFFFYNLIKLIKRDNKGIQRFIFQQYCCSYGFLFSIHQKITDKFFFITVSTKIFSSSSKTRVLKIQICHNRNQLHFNIARDIVILNHHNFYYLFFKYIFLFFQINAALVFIKYIKNINRSYWPQTFVRLCMLRRHELLKQWQYRVVCHRTR